jgi:ABC-type bacteriocin/lantibiotic exporter with double-glycine peptidase domain
MAAAGAIMMKLMSSLTEQGQASYAKAGAFATEVISGIRTIAAFASEPTAGTKYQASLAEARKFGIRTGFASGLGVGFMLMVMYGVYALALWYGSELIIKGVRNSQCEAILEIQWIVYMS